MPSDVLKIASQYRGCRDHRQSPDYDHEFVIIDTPFGKLAVFAHHVITAHL